MKYRLVRFALGLLLFPFVELLGMPYRPSHPFRLCDALVERTVHGRPWLVVPPVPPQTFTLGMLVETVEFEILLAIGPYLSGHYDLSTQITRSSHGIRSYYWGGEMLFVWHEGDLHLYAVNNTSGFIHALEKVAPRPEAKSLQVDVETISNQNENLVRALREYFPRLLHGAGPINWIDWSEDMVSEHLDPRMNAFPTNVRHLIANQFLATELVLFRLEDNEPMGSAELDVLRFFNHFLTMMTHNHPEYLYYHELMEMNDRVIRGERLSRDEIHNFRAYYSKLRRDYLDLRNRFMIVKIR